MQQPRAPESAHRRAASSTCSAAPRRTIGCMAGILRLFSPYHRSHHRKRLTAKQQQQPPPSSAPKAPTTPSWTPKKQAAEAEEASPPPLLSPLKPMQHQPTAAVPRRRRSCDAPRSPTIAPEHRRSSCDSPRPPPPAIVARLMGLEESAPPSPATAAAASRAAVVLPTRPPPPPPPPHQPPETAAEKRRKLLGALEKCDEDLKMLRRIIAAVRAAEMRAAAAASDAGPPVATSGKQLQGANEWVLPSRDEHSPSPSPSPSPQQRKPRSASVEKYQYPSPDSVLDATISSPRFPCRKRPSPCTDLEAGRGNGSAVAPSAGTTRIVKPSRTFVFSGGDYCKIKASDDLQMHAAFGLHDPRVAVAATEAGTLLPARLPRAAGAESWRHHRRRWELEAAAAGRVIGRAMVESVGDVWVWRRRAAGEQEWECGKVAAALERAILQDLVSDVVSELLAQSGHAHSGAAGCRMRLCF